MKKASTSLTIACAIFSILTTSFSTVYAAEPPKQVESQEKAKEPTPPPSATMEDNLKDEVSHIVTPSYEGTFIKMMLALVGIVAFLFLAAWSLKKLSNSKMLQSNFAKKIKILEKRPLSPKTVLYLVEMNGKEVLISESQLEVRALTSTDEKLP